nr:hypothetical protein [Tanacetum cinerariifolium]
MLPVELTNKDIKNSAAYKEYYDIAFGSARPKTKASVRKTQSNDDDQNDTDDDQDSYNDGDDFVHPKLSTHDEEAKDGESFDHIVQTPSQVENSDDESNDDESHGINVRGEEGPDAEDDDKELYRDVNINLEGRDVQMTYVHTTQVLEDVYVTLTPVNPDGQQQSSSVSSQFVTSMFKPSPDAGIDSFFETTHMVDVPVSNTVVPLLVTAPTFPPPSIPIMSQVQQASAPTPTTTPSTFLPDLPNFGSLFGYIDHQMNEAVKVAVQLQSDRLRDEAQAENEDLINKLDENIQKIIKEQMESNKSIYRSDEQRNLYKALVDAYECDKIILDTYRDRVMLKRRRDDADKYEEPSARSDWGSKRRREGKEPESKSAPKQKASKTTDTLTPKLLAGPTYELMKGSCKSPMELEFFLEEVYKFKEGDFKRLRIQDIEDMLLLLVQGKLINLTIKERFAFNVSLRMFTRSIVIQRRVEYLQLGVKSYQKKLNPTKPDTYRKDLKRTKAYTAYSKPRGFIYQNKDKQNRLMRIDELHKFRDDTLNDVRTALDDRLKGIQMKYFPQTIWRRSDKERVATMIQAIDKLLKTRRIMRSLEKFVDGRLYEGGFKMLQRTISLLQSLWGFQDWICVVYALERPSDPLNTYTSLKMSECLVLRIENTILLVENADSEATEVACTLIISMAMHDKTGNIDSFAFQKPKRSKVANTLLSRSFACVVDFLSMLYPLTECLDLKDRLNLLGVCPYSRDIDDVPQESTLFDSESGSESRPPMLNKENYVPWSSRLLRYAKSRPNGKLIHNFILNGPYVRRMIPKPGDAERDVNVNETFHEQTNDGLSEKELKQIEADDQAIQTILLDITDPTTTMNMALSLMAKAVKLKYSTPTNNNQRISSNPRNRQIAQPGMNMGQDRQMQMVGGNGGNQFRQYAGQNAGNLNGYNVVQNVRNQVAQNPRVQNDGNQNWKSDKML